MFYKYCFSLVSFYVKASEISLKNRNLVLGPCLHGEVTAKLAVNHYKIAIPHQFSVQIFLMPFTWSDCTE